MIVTFFLIFAFVGFMLFQFAIAISNVYIQFTFVAFFMAGVITTVISSIVAVCDFSDGED